MGVEVLCRVEILHRVGGTHGCLLVTSIPYSRMVICAVKPLSHWTATVLRQLATDIASGSQSSLETVASDS